MNDNLNSVNQPTAEKEELLNLIKNYVGKGGAMKPDLSVKSGTFSNIFSRMISFFVIFKTGDEGKTFSIEYLSRDSAVQTKIKGKSGFSIADIFPGHKISREVSNILTKVYERKQSVHQVVPFKTKKNGIIWGDFNFSPFFGNEVIGVFRNVTELVDLFNDFELNKRNQEQLQDNVPIGLFQTDPEGNFDFVNKWFAKILGYRSAKLILDKRLKDLFCNEAQYNSVFSRLQSKGRLKETEVKLKHHIKGEIWAVLSIQCVYNQKHELENIDGYLYDITAKKSAMEKLKDSEGKYKALYSFFRLMADNVPDMIWAKNLNNEYIFTNKALCNNLLMAKDVEEPIGKTNLYFAERERTKYPEDPNWYTFGDMCSNSDEIVLHNKRYQAFEEYGTVHGQYVFYDVHKTPLVDDAGNIIGTVGSARNVTRQKMLERERIRDEQIKNVVYRISNAIRTTKDLNELYTVIRLELSQMINTTNLFIALYDKKKDRLSLPYFMDERDRFSGVPGKKTLTHYLLQHNKPLLLREKDYLELVKSEKVELTGTPAKVWLGVPLNISEETSGAIVVQNYKDANAFTELDLELLEFVSTQISVSINQKQADDTLRENEFMLREIIDNVPVMIFAKDREQRFVLANKAFASAYGKRVGEVEGMLQSEIHPIADEVVKFKQDDQLLLNKKSKRIETEENFTDSKGDSRILRTVKVPFNQETDKGIAILGVAIDITETKNNEIELKNAKNKAEESDKLKTAFLANMSHEIRTPMNAIIGFSELLNDPDLSDTNRKEFINLIGDNSKILLNLIEDIIDVAKIEAHQVKIVRSTCQVNSVLDELAEYYQKQLIKYPDKDIKIELDQAFQGDDFMIITDPLRLRQVLNNLIGNAIKFTEKGVVRLGYILKDEETLQFYVEDTGIGLAKEKLGLIFERFRQAEESSTKEYGGTGLGLTISQRLVEMLGGKMWVESVLSEGSTFYFSIPYRPAKGGLETKLFKPQSDKQDWSDKTILVAEDESSNYELIKATLLRTNARVIRAINGREAVNICKKNKRIDLILMDIRMPVMNGYEATRLIKAENKNMPVISLTAYAMSDDKDKSFRAGCDEYVSKPFNPIDLLEKISKYLR